MRTYTDGIKDHNTTEKGLQVWVQVSGVVLRGSRCVLEGVGVGDGDLVCSGDGVKVVGG